MQFAYPQLLWLLLLLPVIALLRSRRGPRAAVRYSSVGLAREVARTSRSRAAWLLPFLRLPAAALLIIALARPQTAHSSTSVKASGVDVMLAIDVSSSMGALDLSLAGKRTDRLTVVKSVVDKFIDHRPNDRLGMIAFAGAPYLVSPLTLDHDWLQRNLARVELGTVEDGTAIGSALSAAVNRLRTSDAHTKIVVLLTDGVNNAGKVHPQLAAEAAAALGIKVYTIGVGTDGEAPMPITDEDGRRRVVMAQATWTNRCFARLPKRQAASSSAPPTRSPSRTSTRASTQWKRPPAKSATTNVATRSSCGPSALAFSS
jgi:Ca-activated chloride channel family protein